jgi:hypothetical protein
VREEKCHKKLLADEKETKLGYFSIVLMGHLEKKDSQ